MKIGGVLLALSYAVGSCHAFAVHQHRSSSSVLAAAPNGESHSVMPDGDGGKENDNLLAQSSSRLSHAMLKVPSVDQTVAFWKESANGQVTASSKLDSKKKCDDELRSAFVVLGNGKTTDDCFALELVQNKEKTFDLGNSLPYLGVSKLVQYASKEDLISVITGTAPKLEDSKEPNGIAVQSCASAPGDFFCRFCLKATSMGATTTFYADILGMKIAAVDEKMVCLRYEDKEKDEEDDGSSSKASFGVPTTLVFEPLGGDEDLEPGNCFDHLVIATKADINEVYSVLESDLNKSDLECHLFMKPTEMFGQKVCGVMDPNGFKIILTGPA